MSIVLEARRLPFSSITEEYASQLPCLLLGTSSSAHSHEETAALSSEDVAKDETRAMVERALQLPLWDRCLLAAVLPLVQESSGEDHSRTKTGEETAHTSASVADVQLAMRIVRALDELEVAYDHINLIRAEAKGGPLGGEGQLNMEGCTAEDILMEELLRERMGADAFFVVPPAGSGIVEDGSEEEEEEEEEKNDIAMAFDLGGESVGIGSAAVFGEHGYHPPSPQGE